MSVNGKEIRNPESASPGLTSSLLPVKNELKKSFNFMTLGGLLASAQQTWQKRQKIKGHFLDGARLFKSSVSTF